VVIEMIDVLAPAGQPTGIRKTKAEVHRDGDWHLAAHVWIVAFDGSVLVQRRSPRKENNPDLWDVSCAGHVSAGESSFDAAVRETHEEIGLRIEAQELHFLATIPESCVLNNATYLDNEFHDIFIVRRHFDISLLTLDPEEVAEVKWVEDLQPDASFVPHPQEYVLLSRWLSSNVRRRG
jgi:isopentenyl-diphosphate Delta-isomerase